MKPAIFCFLAVTLWLPFRLTAAETDFAPFFQGKDGCFLLYDLKAGKMVQRYNATRCALQVSPCSTFKIALALMAFDKGLLKDETMTYKWDGVDRENPLWNRDIAAADWIRNSVVWYSQRITPQLGPSSIEDYLARFNYGNEDISGGLTNFWLGSSLKISPDEQIRFLKKLWRGELPVSRHASELTRKILYLETSPLGTVLSGKTGSHVLGTNALGWFVGHLDGPHGEYLFIVNYDEKNPPKTEAYPGMTARNISKEILTKLGLY
ncbi:MAG: penicillin-binding transpeptidase domain-containing protein [Verrucomicrobiia bacterium]